MLSRSDIIKELGNGINIYPFMEDNLKENSYNLTASQHAWATKNYSKFNIKKGEKAVRKIAGVHQIVLAPLSTTLILTEEVIGVGSIGGIYHSKVGLVSIGLGHIGTMLGPNFCGHSLIAVHNVTDEVKYLAVGKTFSSVVFHKLDTPNYDRNSNVNAHVDKYAILGIKKYSDEIVMDWKAKIDEVSDRMKQSESFIAFKKKQKRYKFKEAKAYINTGNVLVFILVCMLIFSPSILDGLAKMEIVTEDTNQKYNDFFYSVGVSGVFVLLFQYLYSRIKPNR